MKNIEIYVHKGGNDPADSINTIEEIKLPGSYIYKQTFGLYLTIIAVKDDSYFKWSAYTIGHENYPAVFKSKLI